MSASQDLDEFPGDSDTSYGSLPEMEFQSNVSDTASAALRETDGNHGQEENTHVQEFEELLSESESEEERGEEREDNPKKTDGNNENNEFNENDEIDDELETGSGLENTSLVEIGDELNDESDAFDDSDLEVIRVTSSSQTGTGTGYNREQSVIDVDSEEDIENLESEEENENLESEEENDEKKGKDEAGQENNSGHNSNSVGDHINDSPKIEVQRSDDDLDGHLHDDLEAPSDEELLEDSDSPISTEAKKRTLSSHSQELKDSPETGVLKSSVERDLDNLSDGIIDSLSEDENNEMDENKEQNSIVDDDNDSSVTDDMKPFTDDVDIKVDVKVDVDDDPPLVVEYLGKRYMIYRETKPKCDFPDVEPLHWDWEALGTVKDFLQCVMISSGTDVTVGTNQKIKTLRIPDLNLVINEEHEDADGYDVDELVELYKTLLRNSKQPKPKYLCMLITFDVSFREQYSLVQKYAQTGKTLGDLRSASVAAEAAEVRDAEGSERKRRRIGFGYGF